MSRLKYTLLCCTPLLLASVARAQADDGKQHEQSDKALEAAYEQVTRTGAILSLLEADNAARVAAAASRDVDDFTIPRYRKAMVVGVHAACALGNAVYARDLYQQLKKVYPEYDDSYKAAVVLAQTAGDAKLAREAARKLGSDAEGEVRRYYGMIFERMEIVGTDPPEMTLTTANDREFALSEPNGMVRILHVWRFAGGAAPNADERAVVRAWNSAYRASPRVQVIGVNLDASDDVERAKKFADDSAFRWPVAYPQSDAQRKQWAKALRFKRPNYVVVIDQFGYFRSAGATDDPGLVYAVRAAVDEASKKRTAVLPRDVTGEMAEMPEPKETQRPLTKTGGGKSGGDNGGDQARGDDLPSNREAAAKLNRARQMLRMKRRKAAKELFQEIVNQYPGTKEAKQAQEYLNSL